MLESALCLAVKPFFFFLTCILLIGQAWVLGLNVSQAFRVAWRRTPQGRAVVPRLCRPPVDSGRVCLAKLACALPIREKEATGSAANKRHLLEPQCKPQRAVSPGSVAVRGAVRPRGVQCRLHCSCCICAVYYTCDSLSGVGSRLSAFCCA